MSLVRFYLSLFCLPGLPVKTSAASSISKSPDFESKENRTSKLSSPIKSQVGTSPKTTASKQVFKRKRSLENSSSDQAQQKKSKSDQLLVQRKSNANPNVSSQKLLTNGSDVTCPKPDLKSPTSDQNKNVKTKKLMKNVDPNQKTILQYFISQSSPV